MDVCRQIQVGEHPPSVRPLSSLENLRWAANNTIFHTRNVCPMKHQATHLTVHILGAFPILSLLLQSVNSACQPVVPAQLVRYDASDSLGLISIASFFSLSFFFFGMYETLESPVLTWKWSLNCRLPKESLTPSLKESQELKLLHC